MPRLPFLGFLLAITASAIVLILTSSPSSGATIIVPDDAADIQSAIDLAVLGDVVQVRPNTYAENITIDKAIRVESTDGSALTTINGPITTTGAVTITADGADLVGFTLTGGRYAIDVTGGVLNLAISDVILESTGTYHAYAPPSVIEALVNGVTLVPRGDDKNAIYLRGGTLANDSTWPALPADFCYYLNSVLVKVEGAAQPVLTLESGTVIKLANNGEIYVGVGTFGGMVANNTIFTSYADDSVGGDTTGDGSASVPNWSQWRRVYIGSNALPASTTFTNCEFRYGGQDSVDMVDLRSPATLTGCTFFNSYQAAMSVVGASPTVTGCTFEANYIGLEMSGVASAATISGNTLNHDGANSEHLIYSVADCVEDIMTQNTLLPRADGKKNRLRIKASTLTTSATWPAPPAGFVYWIQNELLRINDAGSPVLTLLPETIVKLQSNATDLCRPPGSRRPHRRRSHFHFLR